ncbi:ATP-binding protein [Spirillospora sp. NPDC029432]|uniref:ATP-binding protein n=1 Tax=Spirillospora sp. NPDC029432 TaxID=3154599 RepID=UPI0034518C32
MDTDDPDREDLERAGPTERGLDRTAGRYAVLVRAGVIIPCGLFGLVAAPREHRAAAAALVVLVIAWCALRLLWTERRTPARLPRPTPARLVAVDAAVLLAAGLGQGAAGVRFAGSWVQALTGITAVTYAYEWAARPALALGMAALSYGAYIAGLAAAPDGRWPDAVPLVLRGAAETLIGLGCYAFVRRRARAADRVIARGAARRRSAAVDEARRAGERRHLATLHDTASTTLLMVADGAWDGGREPLRERARHDLEALGTAPAPESGRLDLADLLAGAAEHRYIAIRPDVRGPLPLPAEPALAIFHGVREAVRNVERHAGVAEAELYAARDEGGAVEVEVRDAGRGFDPDRVPAHRRGLAGSIEERMASAGGCARVDSRPGGGTVVRWRWPGPGRTAEPGGGPRVTGGGRPARSADRVRQGLLGGFRIAVLAVAVIVQFAFCLGELYSARATYTALWPQIAAFGLLTLVAAAGGLLAWTRGPSLAPAVRWTCVGLVLLASLAATVSVPGGAHLSPAHWSFGLVGWYGLFLLFDLPPVYFAAFLGAHLVLNFAGLAAGQALGSAVLASMGIVAVQVCGFQLAVGMIAVLLRRVAGSAARAAERDERLRIRAAVDESTHRDHQRRRLALARTTVPLLTGLADGSLDPSDPGVRSRCALEAARLRRLFAEYDGVDDQLVHELHATIDVAERNGVGVRLAVRGRATDLPRDVRRALIEPVAAVIVAAGSAVRATVVRTPGEVRLSAVADNNDQAMELWRTLRASHPTWSHIKIAGMATEHRLWVETIWRPGERSP